MRAIDRFRETLAQTSVLHGFQLLLMRCATAADRKGLIMDAHSAGALTDDETTLLIQALQLETA